MEMKQLKNQTNSDEQEVNKKQSYPVTLKFDNIVYKIKTKNQGFLKHTSRKCNPKKLGEKIILKGVTGEVVPGEMLAMLGPSGSGKTTLLNALGRRLIGGDLSGSITYNGKPFSNGMNRRTGFVTQDDIFHPHLTVIETLIFTALLRLPQSFTLEEKSRQAKAVISQLGLTKCKDNIMGGAFVRGVSGGERKRVSIGQEMLINPSLLFLDEPTSGLDSRSAQQVVSILLELANGGRTVLMSIHQPSMNIFYMFHKILLLSSDGNPLYFGKTENSVDYFSCIGYSISNATTNPADFLLDLAEGVCPGRLNGEKEIKQHLVSAYKTNLSDRIKEEFLETGNLQLSAQFEEQVDEKQFSEWNTSWIQQFLVLLKRDLKERKHESFSGMNVCQILVFSCICGLLWWQSSSLQDQMGFLFFCTLFWSVRPFYNSVPTFPLERMMLTKERSSSMYRLSSYFIAKTVADLPMELVLPTVFVVITYWMGGLKPTAAHFFKTLFVILYGALVSQGVGLALGAVVMNIKASITFGSVIVETFFLASGYYVQNVPKFVSWCKYISPSYFTYKLLLASQFKADDIYQCVPNNATCKIGSYPAIQKIGLGNVGTSIAALTVMLVGYRVIAYLALMRIGVAAG
ncbi:hypothetical protein C5167_012026 [Papaver somniferum]|uniref:ABC transporter domain-containing protein n=1 Tax=Papaver somniferum TaxID=3469 RepID=A0A4Y7IYA7_PAPSO|nr:ABC transporter G family member 9-like [Papaver somniferum]RZC53166.1 hypothetical protein C5167_012026 [Papaver somniferum]